MDEMGLCLFSDEWPAFVWLYVRDFGQWQATAVEIERCSKKLEILCNNVGTNTLR